MGTTYKLTDHRSLSRLALTLLATLSLLATQLVGFAWANEHETGGGEPEEEVVQQSAPGPELDCTVDPMPEGCPKPEPDGEEPVAVDCTETPDDPSCEPEEPVSSLEVQPLSGHCATGDGNIGDSLDQWANGKPDDDVVAGSNGEWQNGNLNANNSQYREGDSVGFRRILTGLQADCRYRVFINYDTVNNGLVAYDYLTNWDRTESRDYADPTSDVDGLGLGDEARVAIDNSLYLRVQDKTGVTADGDPDGPLSLSAFGATWQSGDGVVLDSYSDEGEAHYPDWPASTESASSSTTVTTTVQIDFTANSSTVVLAWGGHIAQKSDWEPLLTAPRETKGSPYHMRNAKDIVKLIGEGEDQTLESVGNQDRSLKAGAVLLPGLNISKGIAGDESSDDSVPVFVPEETFAYELTVTNTGGDSVAATNVTVTDTDLAALLDVFGTNGPITIDEATDPNGYVRYCDPVGTSGLSCNLGDVAVDEVVTITIPLQVTTDLTADECGPDVTYTNTATVHLEGDPVDDDSAEVKLSCAPGLTVEKEAQVEGADPDGEEGDTVWETATGPLEPGESFRYQIKVDSTGNITAPNVTTVDDLSEVLAIANLDSSVDDIVFTYGDGLATGDWPPDCAFGGDSEVLTCTLGDLPVGDHITIHIPMTVNGDLTANQCGDNVYANTVDAQIDGEDIAQDTATIELACAPDVSFDKQLAEGSPSSLSLGGGSTTYELTATNDGTARATDIVIRDTVPDVFEINTTAFTEANAGVDCDIDGNEVVCGPVDVAAGGSVTIEIPVSLTSGLPRSACGIVTNAGELYEGLTSLVEVDFDQLRPADTDSVNVTIVCPPLPPDTPQITLDKTADPTSLVLPEGEDATAVVTYTYTALNSGDVTLTNVTLTDDVLGDLTDELRAALGKSSMSVGESVTFSVDQTVDTDDVGLLVNIATVSGTGGGRTVTDSDTAIVEISQVLGQVFEPSIDIVKEALIAADTDGLKTVTVPEDGGADITYRYTITNTGDTTLAGITLVDDVIGDLTALLETTTLAPDESTVLKVTYSTTAADLAAGGVDNVAIVRGTSPQGATVQSSDDESVGIVEVLAEVVELPRSGADTTRLTALGLVLAALGSATLLLGARRRRGHPL